MVRVCSNERKDTSRLRRYENWYIWCNVIYVIRNPTFVGHYLRIWHESHPYDIQIHVHRSCCFTFHDIIQCMLLTTNILWQNICLEYNDKVKRTTTSFWDISGMVMIEESTVTWTKVSLFDSLSWQHTSKTRFQLKLHLELKKFYIYLLIIYRYVLFELFKLLTDAEVVFTHKLKRTIRISTILVQF